MTYTWIFSNHNKSATYETLSYNLICFFLTNGRTPIQVEIDLTLKILTRIESTPDVYSIRSGRTIVIK